MKIKTLYKYRRFVRVMLDPAEGETGNAGGGGGADSRVAVVEDRPLEKTMPEAKYEEGIGSNIDDFRNFRANKPETQGKPKEEASKVEEGKSAELVSAKGSKEEQEADAAEEARLKAEEEAAAKAKEGEGKGKEGEQVDDKGESRREAAEDKGKEEEHPIFERFPAMKLFHKKMDKAAWTNVQSVLGEFIKQEAELKETKDTLALAQKGIAKIPDSYYENPSAIVLLPDFQRVSGHVNMAQSIASHWEQQLQNIMSGEPWYDLIDETDPRTGQVIGTRVDDKPRQADGRSQYLVSRYLSRADRQLELLTQEQNRMIGEFKENVGQRLAKIQQAEKELFPNPNWEKKDTAEFKLKEYVAEGVRQLGISETNPAFRLLVKTGAAYLQLKDYVTHSQNKEQRRESISAKAKQAGPTGKVTGASGGGSEAAKAGDDVMDEFKKVLINPQF